MIVALASRTASPGVTTLAALVAANWDDPDAVRLIVEADPAGGALAARWSAVHGVTWDPGLLDLSTRRSDLAQPGAVAAVSQPLADDLWLTAAPPAPDQVRAALTRMGDAGAAALAATPGLAAIVDCGRLTSRSPALPLAQRAVVTVMLCRPHLEEIYGLASAVDELRDAGCQPVLVCVGDRPYEPAEVGRALRLPLLGVVPDDPRAARELRLKGLTAGRAYRRSQLARSVQELTSILRARVSELLHPLEVSLPRPAPAAGPAPTPDGGPMGGAAPPQPPDPARTGDVPPHPAAVTGSRALRPHPGGQPSHPGERSSRPGEQPSHEADGAGPRRATVAAAQRWLPPSGGGRD